MSFQLVKENVSGIRCDAIVNFIPPAELENNSFRFSELFDKAGPSLYHSFSGWEELIQNPPVLTRAYNLPLCRYIIHTAGIDNAESVLEQLPRIQKSLEEALAIAKASRCTSLAIPLLCFSNENSNLSLYRVFVNVIREFLSSRDEENEMTVFLSVPGDEAGLISDSIHADVSQYLEDNYIDIEIDDTSFFSASYRRPAACISDFDFPIDSISASEDADVSDVWSSEKNALPLAAEEEEDESEEFFERYDYTAQPEYSAALAFPYEEIKEKKSESYEDQDKSFVEMVDWWIEKKDMKMKDFYLRSNLNRAMLSNLRCHPGKLPKKTNAIACAIGLGLTFEQAEDLIGRAGFSFSKYVKSDVIVEYFIKNGLYDIFRINEELFSQDLALLGTG